MFDTQLSDFHHFDYDSIIFYKPETIPWSGNSSETDWSSSSTTSRRSFQKIKIAVKNEDGSVGDLVFSTPPSLYSFGIQKIHDTSGNVTGYLMPISLWKKREPTPEESQFQHVLQTIVDLAQECVEHYVDHKIDLKRFSPLSSRTTTTTHNESELEEETTPRAPILYSKLMFNKQENKISTVFINEQNNSEIQPLSILSQRCFLTGAIKIDSIFIGDKITLQIKLYEAIIQPLRPSAPRRLLLIPQKNENNDSNRTRSSRKETEIPL